LAEIVAATNNFAIDAVIGKGGSGTVYRGRLQDGREVAIKRFNLSRYSRKEFRTELVILSRIKHKHIIGLLGSCVTVSKGKRTTPQKNKKCLLSCWRKEPEQLEEPEEPESLIVYEYMENGTLFDHLHADQGSSMLSPVAVSWKMRIDVLLGVSRANEHLHCHANPPIIHGNTKSAKSISSRPLKPRNCKHDFQFAENAF
jgi:serine/threonine protein kinase